MSSHFAGRLQAKYGTNSASVTEGYGYPSFWLQRLSSRILSSQSGRGGPGGTFDRRVTVSLLWTGGTQSLGCSMKGMTAVTRLDV